METQTVDKERFFSIELESKNDLKNITLTNDTHEKVLIEGSIGELVRATFAEGVVLELVGKRGTLRVSLKDSEITQGEVIVNAVNNT